MSQVWEYTEHTKAYYLCIFVMMLPIITIILLPLLSTGLGQLPWALLMCAFVLLPLVSCGTRFKGRPLFQSAYHGTPFQEEVMDLTEDERVV